MVDSSSMSSPQSMGTNLTDHMKGSSEEEDDEDDEDDDDWRMVKAVSKMAARASASISCSSM